MYLSRERDFERDFVTERNVTWVLVPGDTMRERKGAGPGGGGCFPCGCPPSEEKESSERGRLPPLSTAFWRFLYRNKINRVRCFPYWVSERTKAEGLTVLHAAGQADATALRITVPGKRENKC